MTEIMLNEIRYLCVYNTSTYIYNILYILKKTWDKYSTILIIQINVQAVFNMKK